MHASFGVWIGFNLFVFVMIAIDLLVLGRHGKIISIKQALATSAIYISIALLFNYGLFLTHGKEVALNFLAGYLIEKSLSVDNLFVFLVIFKYFHTPREYQHKVLFWGIVGALVMRAAFIFFGIALVNTFHWVFYLFGAFLIFTAIKMALPQNEAIHPENNPVLKLLRKFLPLTADYEDGSFFVRRLGKWWATPLLAVLLTVETTDVMFALDSIPAVMAITLDPFIIYTSNIFAILGLRSLFFALSGMMHLFHFLHYALAAILAFVGLKMVLAGYIDVPIGLALGFIALALAMAVAASLLFPKRQK